MNFFLTNFKWLMLVAGLLTCTMFLGFFSPNTSLLNNFGETMQGPLAEIIVRNWSALIGISGIMLIYGAFVEPVRRFALFFAGLGKAVFIFLVLSYGKQYLEFGAGTAVVADLIMIVVFLAYLVLSRHTAET